MERPIVALILSVSYLVRHELTRTAHAKLAPTYNHPRLHSDMQEHRLPNVVKETFRLATSKRNRTIGLSIANFRAVDAMEPVTGARWRIALSLWLPASPQGQGQKSASTAENIAL